jgi:hypothetical protein
VAGYPAYGNACVPPTYGYVYVPAANPYVQPAYAYPPAQPYGLVSSPVWVAPSTGPALTAPLYGYSGTARRLYRPAAPARTGAATAPPAPSDQSKAAEQEKRTNDELIRVKVERNQARTELSMWTALGVTPEQVRSFQEQLAKLQAQIKFLGRRNNELEYQLSRYEGPEKEIKLPAGLRGTVLAVDPKYQFVVLNIGENQGVVKDGDLLVNRRGKLVAKLQVTTVKSNSSVANILPDWKMGNVMEGDQVFP